MVKSLKHFTAKFIFSFKRSIVCVVVAAFAFCSNLSAINFQPQSRVLFIGSGEPDLYANEVQLKGLKSVLKENCKISAQFFETEHSDGKLETKDFYKRIKDYIGDNNFDAYVISGDDAFNFLLDYHDELFADKPVVFAGVVDPEMIRRGLMYDNVTGIKEVLYFDENILLAKSLFPDLKHIYLVSDNSFAGTIGRQMFDDLKMRFKGISFTQINTSNLTLVSIRSKLKDAQEGDVVLYLSARDTIDGPLFSGYGFIADCCSANKIPILSCSYSSMFEGSLGGYFTCYETMGRRAGKLIEEVISGLNPKYINVSSDSPAQYYFDWAVMKKFNLKKTQLPNDTVYANDDDSFSKPRKTWIVITVILCLVSLSFLICFIVQIHKKEKLEEMLQENRKMLHAVMDQSETVYWECDFSKELHNDEIVESDSAENLEELESVEDDVPLGRVMDKPTDVVEIKDGKEYFNKNQFNINTDDVVLGWIYSGIIQREYREQFREMLQDFKDGRIKKSIEIDIPIGIEDIRNNVQTERWKHILYRALKVENGKVVRAICSATDVTNQKRAEREYEGIMKYQSFVQQNYPAYSRLNLTKNKVLERLVNVPDISKGIKGNSAVNELEFLRELITERGQNEGFASMLDREELIIAFKNGSRQKECSFCFKLKNGALHWFNLCMELAFNPSSGDIEAYCYLKDITSQTIATITKDMVLNEDVDYIFWLNKVTGVCQFINKSDYVDDWIPEGDVIDYDNLLASFIKKKIPDPDKEKIRTDFSITNLEKGLETSDELRYTYHTRKEDGSIEIKQEKVYYLEKGSNILLFVCTDITAITMMENQQNEKLALAIKQAERANFAKSDFLSRMSHDLRTPMNGIMGIAELASKELDDKEALERDINKIRSSSSYMLGLLNDILDMSKIESGKLEIRKTPVAFGDILETIITLSHVMCDKNGITFYCNRKPDDYRDFMINVDRLHIQQIAMNLISNASKFTPSGGRIEFLLDSADGENGILHSTIIIRDTGAGMTKEFQKIMYDAFTQDSNSVNKVGTGLGLAIVHNLVRLMGGTIECVSAPGEGTEFTIKMDIETLESTAGGDSGAATMGAEKISGASGTVDIASRSVKGKRVLLVEDNELNQEIASRLLMNEGMEVEIAGNGLDSLNMFSEKGLHYYDIILMDVMMPVMDGLQATHLLRTLEREDAKEIPIIAMTANAFTEDIERCLEAGMNTHIAKPIETEKMINTIKEYIGS